jgi:hypothetical protein
MGDPNGNFSEIHTASRREPLIFRDPPPGAGVGVGMNRVSYYKRIYKYIDIYI